MLLTNWALGDAKIIVWVYFRTLFTNYYLEHFLWNCLRWVPQNTIHDKSKLVQVMAWCRQATRHYLNHVDPDPCRHMASLGRNELSGPPRKIRTVVIKTPWIARFMGPTWGPYGADRTQVGPMLVPWTLLSGTRQMGRLDGGWEFSSIFSITSLFCYTDVLIKLSFITKSAFDISNEWLIK